MNKDQKILELQQKIELLETQKHGLQEELYKVEVCFQQFKSQYSSVMSDMSAKLSSLSESINSLRNELTILTSAETEPEPVVTEQVKEETSASDFVFDGTPIEVENGTAKEEVEQAASYEACVAGMESSTVVSDLNNTTVQPEQVEESVEKKQTQKTVEKESVTETVAETSVQEAVEAEPVKETVQTEYTQKSVESEPVQEEPVKTENTQKTVETETAQSGASAASRQSAPSEPQEETIFDKLRNNFDWEKFIGENLIMKLGILIVLIGVAIGGKYAIEHQLLSPAMRMIMGVVFGAALQGVAIKLKKNYKKLSAVLASGSMATLYFMTFFSYHLYGLIPMPVAFVAMTLITVATVWLACSYDMEIIAIIGLVGAYVIPFALSTGDGGSPWILFSYISIINAGVMFISVKRYWRILFVSAFASSWLILIAIYRFGDFSADSDSVRMLLFLFVNFAIFYVTFLAYKVKHSMIFQHFDIHFLLSNSFLFFGLGYNVMYNNAMLAPYVVWFTLFNAILHAVVAFMLVKKDMVDKSVSRLIAGLAISFLTIAILVWMTGHWLTMFWMLEGTVLFTVSRVYKRPFYEKMSYPILFLALVSLIIDWGNPNGGHLRMLTPLFEAFAHYRTMWDVSTAAVQGSALSIINTLVFIALCIFLTVVDHRYPLVENEETQNSWMRKASLCLKVMAVFVVTTAILVHIERPWLTMCWMLEATILFTFARVRKNLFFEKSAYPVFALALISLLFDWGDTNAEHLYGYALYVANTIVCMVFVVCVAVLNYLYPLAETEEAKDTFVIKASQFLYVMAIFVVTLAIYVHIEQPWMTVLWSAEALLLCYLGRTKSIPMVEIGSYCLVALSTVGFLHAWGSLSSYDFFNRVDLAADSFSMSIGEMWKSLVAGLSLIMATVGVLWMVNKYKPMTDDVAGKYGLTLILERFLVIVLSFVIWTHTPWIITTILYFALALGCLYWSLRYNAKQKGAFLGVLALAFICWCMDINCGHTDRNMIVMLVGTMISVAFVYLMRRYNEKTEFAETKVTNVPFVAILELMPFIAFGIVVMDKAEDWVMCYALAYFSAWTFVSLKMNWEGFKKFSMACLCLMILLKLWLGVFELKIGDASAHFSLRHFVSLTLILFSGWTLYCYKKQEGRMFGLTESQTTKAFDSFIYFGSVVVVGKELNCLCQLVGSPESFGVVFSVFLGIVSLFGVYYGLYKDKKYLRIEGFVLLGFTILKLFFYDMAHFDQIYKVIALISLGLSMLVMAYFYQKIAKEKEQTKEKGLPKPEEISNDETQS